MKSILIVVILAIIIGGGWYGTSVWRFNHALDSGRVVLLTNEKLGFYTYSDLMPRDEITRAFKVEGDVDTLTAEEIAAATAHLNLVVGVQPVAGDPRVIARQQTQALLPDAAQQPAWAAAVAQLTSAQQTLCGNIDTTSAQQYCLARHIAYAAFTAKATSSSCAPLYVETQRTECESDLASGNASLFGDADNDQLLDVFEDLATPYEQRVNDRGLPELSI